MLFAAAFEREGLSVTNTAMTRSQTHRPSSLERTQPKAPPADARERESRVIRSALSGSRSVSFAARDRHAPTDGAPFVCG